MERDKQPINRLNQIIRVQKSENAVALLNSPSGGVSQPLEWYDSGIKIFKPTSMLD